MDEYDVAAKRLHATTDPRIWAEEFCKLFALYKKPVDGFRVKFPVDLMTHWFANAMQTAVKREVRL